MAASTSCGSFGVSHLLNVFLDIPNACFSGAAAKALQHRAHCHQDVHHAHRQPGPHRGAACTWLTKLISPWVCRTLSKHQLTSKPLIQVKGIKACQAFKSSSRSWEYDCKPMLSTFVFWGAVPAGGFCLTCQVLQKGLPRGCKAVLGSEWMRVLDCNCC